MTVDLRRLAVVYLAAVHEHRPPIPAVEAEFGGSRAAAANYISRTRAAGLLPRVGKGNTTPEEGHWPRVARMLNNRGDRWLVCLTCHHPWPCRTPDTLRWIDAAAQES